MIDSPKNILAQLLVHKGSTIVDFGAGMGTYTMLLSDIVGREGTVFAVDVQKHLIDKIKKDANEVGKKNIYPMFADIEVLGGVPLNAGVADYIFIVNVLNITKDKRIVFEEAKRLLKGGGRLVVIEHESTPLPNINVFEKNECNKMAQNVGFRIVDSIDAGEFAYGILYQA